MNTITHLADPKGWQAQSFRSQPRSRRFLLFKPPLIRSDCRSVTLHKMGFKTIFRWCPWTALITTYPEKPKNVIIFQRGTELESSPEKILFLLLYYKSSLLAFIFCLNFWFYLDVFAGGNLLKSLTALLTEFL